MRKRYGRRCGKYVKGIFIHGKKIRAIIKEEVVIVKMHQTDFSKGSVYRNILEVAIPMTFAQLLNLLYNIVDRIYIGRIPEIARWR